MLLKDLKKNYFTAQIITHTDLDGYSAGAILVKTLTNVGFDIEDIEVVNTDYSNPLPINELHKLILISDISISNSENAKKLIKHASIPGNLVIWFDHHQTSIDMYHIYPELKDIPGIRSTSGCGAMLCWIFFNKVYDKTLDIYNIFEDMKSANIEAFIKDAPEALKLTDDYDRFVLADERSKYFMEAFNSYPKFEKDCKSDYFQTQYLNYTTDNTEYINYGKKIYLWKRIVSLGSLKTKGFIASFPKEGMDNIEMICMNSINRGSLLFGKCLGSELAIQYNYGCIYVHDGKKFTVSIYCPNPEIPNGDKQIGKVYDASDICKKYGGGGHRGAAGFVTDNLKFTNVKELPIAIQNMIDEEIMELIEEVNKIG